MTHRNTWKARERKVAALFGSERTPLSGGNSKHTRSDTLHGKLFVEAKYRAKHAVLTLWKETAKLAKKEGKVPVVALCEKGQKGIWLLVKDTDLKTVAEEYVGPPETSDSNGSPMESRNSTGAPSVKSPIGSE